MAQNSFINNVFFYTLFRLILGLSLTGIIIGCGLLIGVKVPILVALLLGILISAPVSFVLGKSLRNTVLHDLFTLDTKRRETRQQLHAELQALRDEAR